MFDHLTEDELFWLAHKMSNGGHAAAIISNGLGRIALARPDETCGDETDDYLWAQAARWDAIMDECFGLADDLRSLRAGLAVNA